MKNKEIIRKSFVKAENLENKIMADYEKLEEKKKCIDNNANVTCPKNANDVSEMRQILLHKLDKLNDSKEELIKSTLLIEEKCKTCQINLEETYKERNKMIKDGSKLEEAFVMLEKSFNLMKEEKDGITTMNTNNDTFYNSLKEEYSNLQSEKDKIICRDTALAEKYSHYCEELKTLETAKNLLLFKQEEIAWQSCLLSNQMK